MKSFLKIILTILLIPTLLLSSIVTTYATLYRLALMDNIPANLTTFKIGDELTLTDLQTRHLYIGTAGTIVNQTTQISRVSVSTNTGEQIASSKIFSLSDIGNVNQLIFHLNMSPPHTTTGDVYLPITIIPPELIINSTPITMNVGESLSLNDLLNKISTAGYSSDPNPLSLINNVTIKFDGGDMPTQFTEAHIGTHTICYTLTSGIESCLTITINSIPTPAPPPSPNASSSNGSSKTKTDTSTSYNTTTSYTTTSYTHTYNTASEPEVVSSKNKKVKGPIIYAKDLKLCINSKFNIMRGVTAFERTGKGPDITDKVRTTGKINTRVPGEYEITYRVKDQYGNTTEKIRIVTIIECEADGIETPINITELPIPEPEQPIIPTQSVPQAICCPGGCGRIISWIY